MMNKKIELELNKIGFVYSHPRDFYDVMFNDKREKLEVVYSRNVNIYDRLIYKSITYKTISDLNIHIREEKFKELF